MTDERYNRLRELNLTKNEIEAEIREIEISLASEYRPGDEIEYISTGATGEVVAQWGEKLEAKFPSGIHYVHPQDIEAL